MGNGYEPDQNRSPFGEQSGTKLPGKAEKDTSALRRSKGAESKGGLTPSRETQRLECRPSSDRDFSSSLATSLGTSGTFLLEQCRCQSQTRCDGPRLSRAWRGRRLPGPRRQHWNGRRWRRTHRGVSSGTGRSRQRRVSLDHLLFHTRSALLTAGRYKESALFHTRSRRSAREKMKPGRHGVPAQFGVHGRRNSARVPRRKREK